MVRCPMCGGALTDATQDLNLYIGEEKASVIKDVLSVACTECGFDAMLLVVKVTPEGIFIKTIGGEENG